MSELARKWDSIYSQLTLASCSVSAVLRDNYFLLPRQGLALDLGCGLGANAAYLAERGLAVTAWDISQVAIEKLQDYAVQQGLQINAYQQNISRSIFTENSFDVIVVSRFLDRSLMDAIISALKPNGLLFYQTFTQEKALPPNSSIRHIPSNPDYLLNENELLRSFSDLRLVFYRENGLCGEQSMGLRNEAQFIGQKRTDNG